MCSINNFFKLLFVLFAAYCGDYLKYKEAVPKLLPRSKQDDLISYPTKLIILLCRFRSGSTFLGEIFNQNPNVIYDFESLHPTPLKNYYIPSDDRETEKDTKMRYIQHLLYNCSINHSAFGRVLNKHYL